MQELLERPVERSRASSSDGADAMSIEERLSLADQRARRHAFDVESLRLHGLQAWLAGIAGNPPPWVFAVLRSVLPALRLPGWRYIGKFPVPKLERWVLLTRDEDVREVLGRADVFRVPWGQDVRVLNDGSAPGTPFILGLDTGDPEEAALYWAGLKQVMQAFRRDDVERMVRPLAEDYATEIVEGAGSDPFDAIQTLFVPLFIDTCERYFGVPVPPRIRVEFFQWTVAVSGLLFGPPYERDRAWATAEAGADRVAQFVDLAIGEAIEQARDPLAERRDDLVLHRLARQHVGDPESMSWPTMRAIMVGMIMGSVPTNALAAGHILEVLLSRPEAMEAARAAAHGGDDVQLSRCLFEAMRFRPLNPGPWRRCEKAYVVARGTARETTIRPGTVVLASTQSAMLDPRSVDRPGRFDGTRDPAVSLLFGHGLHWCAGKAIADAQITQGFKALLRREGHLMRAPGAAGRMRLLGLFPEHLSVQIR
ncbi:Cytochrome P450 [Variovorax sp. HW608]|uniref:cytochrome P450 n=1 Tax=Variovorax sp. HW608 TaxID=1034889 RepID=UPI000820209B|nr:cytochrome P450 [Variovorax sp. HW608]SCK52034.1 Cytochrome P450 [Variovorax sp. HW608]